MKNVELLCQNGIFQRLLYMMIHKEFNKNGSLVNNGGMNLA